MLILLLIISIVLIVLGVIVDKKFYDEETSFVLYTIGILSFMCIGVAILIMGVLYVNSWQADEKITMYQDENKKIEKKIEDTVKQYMDFEKDTYKDLKSDSYMNLVSLYPELKSDKLIKEQINTYQTNSKRIIELKEEKIHQKTYKWWLKFGK